MLLGCTELQLGTAKCWVASKSRLTEASGDMAGGAALGVKAAHVGQAAHVKAFVSNTGSVGRAVGVAYTLQRHTAHVGVTLGLGGTRAHGPVVDRVTNGVRPT